MKNQDYSFILKLSKSYILTSILVLIASNCFSQWKTAEANNIKGDVTISYEVIYDKELSLEEKQSSEYLSEITVTFNKDNLIEHRFGYDLKAEKNFWLLNYNILKVYLCSTSGNNKKAIQYDFKDSPVIVEPILNIEPKIIFDFPCEKAKVMINKVPKDIYYTKKIGLKYCDKFKLDGFLIEYPGYSKTLGHYTVKVKKVVYDDLPKSFYSLSDFDIKIGEVLPSLLNTSTTANEIRTKDIGKKAVVFQDFNTKKEKIDTENMLGDVIVYNFWIASESYDTEILKLNQLKKKYKGKNVHFVAIALNSENELTPFLKKYPFDYDIIPGGNSIANKFNVIYPTNIIVDKKGVIQFYEIGYKTDIVEKMTSEIDKYLEQ
ncbi:TlpA family protein disulfide reductase [Flavobacterium sp. WC2509]|uniref:TlpA family protein disulfide reductase n=1 Tax=Flavobacterium sp. WC2509 TaxID=3461406 RepID=UPI004044AF2E